MTKRFQPLPPKALLLFSSLPNELLENIFRFYVPESITAITQNRVRTTPTHLCLVCRRWRDVVQARPELWGVLRLTGAQLQSLNMRTESEWDYGVPPSEEEKRDAAEVLRNVTRYLRRSKCSPLSLEISTDGRSEHDIPVIRSVLEMLIGSGARDMHGTSNEWHYLPNRLREFSFRYDCVRVGFLSVLELDVKVRFSTLQTLDICYSSCSGYSEWPWGGEYEYGFPTLPPPPILSQLPLRCPRLQSLKWSGYACSEMLPKLCSNSATALTHIEIYSAISPSIAIDVLSSFPKLQHCVLHGVTDFTWGWISPTEIEDAKQPHRNIHLPYLKDLTLIGTYLPLIILLRLTAPTIQTLSLVSIYHTISSWESEVDSGLSEFLAGSGSLEWNGTGIRPQNNQVNSRFTTHLTQLKLENIELSAKEYERCLLMLPSLEVLDHYESRDTDLFSNTEPTHALLKVLDRSQDRGAGSKSNFNSDSAIRLLCPNLRSLTLRGIILAPDGVLGHLIKMRLQDDRSILTKIYVEFLEGSHRVDQAMLARVGAKAKAKGKEFNFKVAVCGSQKLQ